MGIIANCSDARCRHPSTVTMARAIHNTRTARHCTSGRATQRPDAQASKTRHRPSRALTRTRDCCCATQLPQRLAHWTQPTRTLQTLPRGLQWQQRRWRAQAALPASPTTVRQSSRWAGCSPASKCQSLGRPWQALHPPAPWAGKSGRGEQLTHAQQCTRHAPRRTSVASCERREAAASRTGPSAAP